MTELEAIFNKALETEIQEIKERKENRTPLKKNEVLTMIHALSFRKSRNKEMLQTLMNPLVFHLNQRNLDLKDITRLIYDLSILSMKSLKFFEMIISYFLS